MMTTASFGREVKSHRVWKDKEKLKAIIRDDLTQLLSLVLGRLEARPEEKPFCHDSNGNLVSGEFDWRLPLTIEITTIMDYPDYKFHAKVSAEGEWIGEVTTLMTTEKMHELWGMKG